MLRSANKFDQQKFASREILIPKCDVPWVPIKVCHSQSTECRRHDNRQSDTGQVVRCFLLLSFYSSSERCCKWTIASSVLHLCESFLNGALSTMLFDMYRYCNMYVFNSVSCNVIYIGIAIGHSLFYFIFYCTSYYYPVSRGKI